MKFKDARAYSDIAVAEKKLLELAYGMEADHAGRLSIGVLNMQMLAAGISREDYAAAMRAAIADGFLTMHPSGGYVSFTQAGADLFA